MKKLLSLIIFLYCFIANAQEFFNGYKYVLLPPIVSPELTIKADELNNTAMYIKKIGLIPIENNTRYPDFETGKKNPCEVLKLEILGEMEYWIRITFNFYNCNEERVWTKQVKLADFYDAGPGRLGGLKKANKKILGPLLKSYSFNKSLTPENSNNVCWFCPSINNQNSSSNNENTITKEEAIKMLKELKELLELELITEKEFEKKSEELKEIILD